MLRQFGTENANIAFAAQQPFHNFKYSVSDFLEGKSQREGKARINIFYFVRLNGRAPPTFKNEAQETKQ